MKKERAFILTINGGSSSVKFALYRVGKIPDRVLYGRYRRKLPYHPLPNL
jgi:hypothetical protein